MLLRPQVLAALAFVLAPAAQARPVPSHDGQPQWLESAVDPVPGPAESSPDFAALAKYARAAVVSITAMSKDVDTDTPSAREFFERYYGGAEPPTKGMASGFIIRSDGYILTNEHVVEDSQSLAVVLDHDPDESYPARVVGRDDLSDLALIKIDVGHPLPALMLGDSDALQVGDWVAAIGNPFGLAQSLTVGVVSFIGRRDINPSGRPGYYDFIQTDASINPGNSGGPLIDRHGRVVGISAAVNASGQGIGFAIPVNMAKDVLPALYETGTLQRSFLGVAIQDLSPELAESFSVAHGVAVTEVTPDGPAARVGLKAGDVITEFDGQPIAHAYRLRWLTSNAGVGSTAKIVYVRAGTPHTADIALAPLPGAPARFHRQPAPKRNRELAPLGFTVGGPVVAGPNGKGLRVTAVDPESRAYIAGLRKGDLVLEAQGHAVRTSQDLRAARGSKVVQLFIQRSLKPMFIGFRLHPLAARGSGGG